MKRESIDVNKIANSVKEILLKGNYKTIDCQIEKDTEIATVCIGYFGEKSAIYIGDDIYNRLKNIYDTPKSYLLRDTISRALVSIWNSKNYNSKMSIYISLSPINTNRELYTYIALSFTNYEM